MKTKRRIECLYLMIILVIGWAFSFSFDITHWEWSWADAMLSDIEPNAMSKKEIVEKYCTSMLNSSDEETLSSFKQSLFAAALCSSWVLKEDGKFAEIRKLTQEDFSYKKAKFQSSCRKEYKEECNVAELVDNLLTQVLSEYFTIREASAFWIGWDVKKFSSSQALRDWETDFVDKYLWVSKQRDFCKNNHKQTCSMIENQMKQFKKALKNLQYINIEELYKLSENEKNDCQNAKFAKANLVYCWLAWEVQWWLSKFVDLVYNELNWYAIFISYYGNIIAQREEIKDNIIAEYTQSMEWPQKFISLTEETLKDLNDIIVTYPIHVTLVAFEEDLLRLRDKYLVKVVTPIYCLYYKLRNVQFNK